MLIEKFSSFSHLEFKRERLRVDPHGWGSLDGTGIRGFYLYLPSMDGL